MGGAGEVAASYLQVTAVQVALVERYGAVDGYFLEAATAHAVVSAFHNRVALTIRESHRAVFDVVDGRPDACFGFDECLIAISVELRNKCSTTILADSGVMVESVRLVHRRLAIFLRECFITDVVVIVAIRNTIHMGVCQLAAIVIAKAVIQRLSVT